MVVTILGEPYEIQVQYHVLNNITYVLLDAPIFRQQTKTDPYPPRLDVLPESPIRANNLSEWTISTVPCTIQPGTLASPKQRRDSPSTSTTSTITMEVQHHFISYQRQFLAVCLSTTPSFKGSGRCAIPQSLKKLQKFITWIPQSSKNTCSLERCSIFFMLLQVIFASIKRALALSASQTSMVRARTLDIRSFGA